MTGARCILVDLLCSGCSTVKGRSGLGRDLRFEYGWSLMWGWCSSWWDLTERICICRYVESRSRSNGTIHRSGRSSLVPHLDHRRLLIVRCPFSYGRLPVLHRAAGVRMSWIRLEMWPHFGVSVSRCDDCSGLYLLGNHRRLESGCHGICGRLGWLLRTLWCRCVRSAYVIGDGGAILRSGRRCETEEVRGGARLSHRSDAPCSVVEHSTFTIVNVMTHL